MKLNIRRVFALLLSLTLALVFTGCAQSAQTPTSGSSSAATYSSASAGDAPAQGAEQTVILIGTSGSPSPYNWVETDGTVAGYEPAILKLVNEALPQYKFEWEVTDFGSIFTGVDTGRFQVGSNNLSRTEEREERYYFADVNHIYNSLVIVFKKGRTDIKGIEDIGGKTVTTSADGVAFQLFLEAYNEANPDNPALITYSDQDWLATFQNIDNGTQDFAVFERAILNNYEEEFGIELDFVPLDSKDTYGLLNLESYFLFPKTDDGAKLRDEFDDVLQKLKDDGTLSALSEEYFGFDQFA